MNTVLQGYELHVVDSVAERDAIDASPGALCVVMDEAKLYFLSRTKRW